MKSIIIVVIIGIIVIGAMIMMRPIPVEKVSIDFGEVIIIPIPPSEFDVGPSQECSGAARCIVGKVTKIIDGDTIHVNGQSVRFALSSAPELNEFNGPEARDFIENLCPVGSTALVDEDDGQTGESFGRIIGVIYCNEVNLNEELLDSEFGYLSSGFCNTSEFKDDDWARKHGC